jgi:outer membrane protein assembly factor BamB
MAEEKRSSRVRLIAFLVLLAIWLIGGVVQAVLWQQLDENRTSQVMSVWIIAPTLLFCTLAWWTFFSGFGVLTKLAGWMVLLLPIGILAAQYRFDGFTGDFVPILVKRSSETAKEKEEKFLKAFKAEEKQEGALPSPKDPEEPLSAMPGDWPQFRGPHGNGIIADGPLRRDWNGETPKAIWEKRVGPGWSSFCVVDGVAFTQMQIGPDESVVAYDLETGNTVWTHMDEGVRWEEEKERAGIGPMATPTFYQGRLYTLGALGILNCLDPKTGDTFWSTNILDDANTENIEWAMAGSPVAYEGKILVNPGSNDEEETAVAAYDWETGEKLWSGGTHPASYSTPVIATLDGVKQILMFDGLGLSGHSLEDGSQLWQSEEWSNQFQINVAKPIVRDDEAIFISTSYNTGSALIKAVKDDDGNWRADFTDWKTNKRFKLKFGDAVEKDGMIYGLSETILTCLDFQTGKIVWQQRGDFGYGQLILVEDVLVILTEDGEVVLVEASKEHPELLRFQALEGKCWSHPAFVRGKLLVRNAAHMACFDLSP